MSLTFNILSSFSSKEQMSFNFMAAITIHSDFGAQENKVSHSFHCFHLFAMKWWDWMPWSLVFWLSGFKRGFSLSSFTFIKKLFSSSLLSAIRVVSSAYGLLVFLLEILIPACDSSIPVFHMMYSSQNLNKHSDNKQTWHTLFTILNQSAVPNLVLTAASWPAYRFLRRQIRWSGITSSLRIVHSSLWSTHSKASAYSVKHK